TATLTVGIPASFTVTSAGRPTPALSASLLPAGLFFTDHGDGTATLGGAPQAGTGGLHTLIFMATNGVGAPGLQSFMLIVNDAGAFTSANTANFTLGVAGGFLVTTSSFPASTFSVTSGALPNGLTLSSSGALSGTPTQSGSFPITVTATNGILPNPTQNLTIVVNAGP